LRVRSQRAAADASSAVVTATGNPGPPVSVSGVAGRRAGFGLGSASVGAGEGVLDGVVVDVGLGIAVGVGVDVGRSVDVGVGADVSVGKIAGTGVAEGTVDGASVAVVDITTVGETTTVGVTAGVAVAPGMLVSSTNRYVGPPMMHPRYSSAQRAPGSVSL
jgi:hypothetical protein